MSTSGKLILNNKHYCRITLIYIYRSKHFRPTFQRLHELRAFTIPGAPMLATTSTVTQSMRDGIIEILDMTACCIVTESPNKPVTRLFVSLVLNVILRV